MTMIFNFFAVDFASVLTLKSIKDTQTQRKLTLSLTYTFHARQG